MNITAARSEILSLGRSRLGYPYVYGAKGPYAFDCEGLLYWIMHSLGDTTYPGGSSAQFYAGPRSVNLIPGMFVFFEGAPEQNGLLPGHCGIYTSPNEFIDAPYTGVDVRYDWFSTSTSEGPMKYWGATDPAQLLISAPPPGEPTLYLTIPYMTGSAVLHCQSRLIAWGYRWALGPSGADSVFGPMTESAVRGFQSQMRIAVDGVCGPITWIHLNQNPQESK